MAKGFLESLKQKPPAVKKTIALLTSAVIAFIILVIALVLTFTGANNKKPSQKGAIDIKRENAINQIKKDLGRIKDQVSAGATDVKDSFGNVFASSTGSSTATSTLPTTTSTATSTASSSSRSNGQNRPQN